MNESKTKIIVASPDPFLCNELEKNLRPYGITVLSAKDKKEAMMRCYSNQDAAFVLLDIDTPLDPVHPLLKDGLQVCVYLKAMFPSMLVYILFKSLDANDIPIVNAVSGLRSSLISFPEARESRADGFIARPPDLNALTPVIRNNISNPMNR